MGVEDQELAERMQYNEDNQHRGEAAFDELKELDPDAEIDDYCNHQGWDVCGIESDIKVTRAGMQVPGGGE